jgi:vacuolar-type H+-ATPase subunit I/STV1
MRDVSEDDLGDGEIWMPYSEAARALGIDVESVKKRARWRGWRRQAGNDGETRVAVPASLLNAAAIQDFRGHIAALENHVATLREQLDDAKQSAANADTRASEALADLRTERLAVAEERRRSADRIIELEGEIRGERARHAQVEGLQAEVERFAGLVAAGEEERRNLVREITRLLGATHNLLSQRPLFQPSEPTLPPQELAEIEAELDQEERQLSQAELVVVPASSSGAGTDR